MEAFDQRLSIHLVEPVSELLRTLQILLPNLSSPFSPVNAVELPCGPKTLLSFYLQIFP
jgi:hypothetical protein